MNLASTIRWMTIIAWLLKNPDATAREGISDERMQEKLGWVEQSSLGTVERRAVSPGVDSRRMARSTPAVIVQRHADFVRE